MRIGAVKPFLPSRAISAYLRHIMSARSRDYEMMMPARPWRPAEERDILFQRAVFIPAFDIGAPSSPSTARALPVITGR